MEPGSIENVGNLDGLGVGGSYGWYPQTLLDPHKDILPFSPMATGTTSTTANNTFEPDVVLNNIFLCGYHMTACTRLQLLGHAAIIAYVSNVERKQRKWCVRHRSMFRR